MEFQSCCFDSLLRPATAAGGLGSSHALQQVAQQVSFSGVVIQGQKFWFAQYGSSFISQLICGDDRRCSVLYLNVLRRVGIFMLRRTDIRGTLGICVFGIFLCGVAVKKSPSLRRCGDLKPYGVRCLHFKVYGVRWNKIICGIPVSIDFGQMTSRKCSCTGEAVETFPRNFAVIFIDLSVEKFKQFRSKGISKVTTVLALWCVCFEIFLARVKTYNPKTYFRVRALLTAYTIKLKLYTIAVTVFCWLFWLFLRWCGVRQYFLRCCGVQSPPMSPSDIHRRRYTVFNLR